ncbi:MAG: geranylgeranyl reductase family protein [archaeon]|nr:geranylgeranyl reductase family protein [archaeon]
MKMLTVVGAGPAGLVAARKAQKLGWETTVLEEHPTIGTPVNCTGIISASGVEELGIRKQVEEVLVNKVRGAQIFSPNHEMVEVKKSGTVAYVVDRGGFDRVLGREAQDAGVEIRLNTKMIDIRNETVFVEHKGRGELLKSRVILGADGVNSKTRRLMGIETDIKNYVHAYQVVAEGNFNPNMVQVYLGDYAKNFFAWVVPESATRARVGLASTSGNIRKDFNLFVQEKNLTGNFCDRCSSLIPVGEPFKSVVKGNLMLVGDAAFHTKATTGGGILLGMAAGEVAANALHAHFKDNKPLSDYDKMLSPINKELRLHFKIREYMNKKTEDDMDNLFRKMNKAGMGEFLSEYGDMDKPSRFLGKILKKPSMWRLFPEALRFAGT